MFTALTLICLMLVLFFVYLTWTHDHWRKRDIEGPRAKLFVGSFPNLIRQKEHFVYDIDHIYKQYKSTQNYVGVFLMRAPMLMILDPKIVHDILVTNFKSFHDNESSKFLDTKKDPLIARNPFLLVGQEWREQRALISPGFTGTRVKTAYSIMQNVCQRLCDFIDQQIKVPSKDGINFKDLALLFTSENVCDSVLGIKAGSFTVNPIPISENVRKFTETNMAFLIYTILIGLFPKFLKIFKAKFIPKDTEDFFLDLMKTAFQMRLESKVDRQDFLNHVLSLKEKRGLSDMDLASHSMTFLIDGLDTTASVISHCVLLLARHSHYQERLFQEIRENMDENGEVSFEKLNDIPYLDSCIHESIRIFSPGFFAIKTCKEPFEFTNKDGKKFCTNIGDSVLLPFYSLHQDPEYFPEPKKFNPDRFMPENGGVKKYREMGVFLPFSDGPRMCLGIRFALVQSKAAIVSIIRNFKVKVNPRTQSENRFSPKEFLAVQDGGVWLNFEKRF